MSSASRVLSSVPAIVLASVALLIVIAVAGFVIIRAIARRSQCWPPERTDDGIRVGAPKVYDNRSLSLMLEELQNQLRALQTIDGNALKSSLGTQQAERVTNLDVGADVTVRPPAASAKESEPAAKDQPVMPAAPFKWSERAGDLLDDQINLSYQIFNLRMLLERAISDRLTDDGKPRVQAVIALPISIDPPMFAVGCAATVEVRLSVEHGRPSLVALFPQEETYNTWSVDRRNVRAGASAASGPVDGAAGIARGGRASELRRQADIVAIEREPLKPEVADRLHIAWQFHPVGRERSVKAGLQQVMAVVALPSVKGAPAMTIGVEVRSSWQRWDQKSATTGDGVGLRAAFSNRPTNHEFGSHGTVNVPSAEELEKKLSPDIVSIDWVRVGRNTACVMLTGHNYFSGTTVVMGDTIVGPNNGLTIKSELSLQIVVPIGALLDDALLNGRYGQALKIANAPEGAPRLQIKGAWIVSRPGARSARVFVYLAPRIPQSLAPRLPGTVDWREFLNFPEAIFAVNRNVVAAGLRYEVVSDDLVIASAMVESEFLSRTSLITLRWPFYGPDWSLRAQAENSEEPLTAVRFASGDSVVLLISGRLFENTVRVIVDREYQLGQGLELLLEDVVRLTLPAAVADAHREILVWEASKPTVIVRMPPAAGATPPTIDRSGKTPPLKAKKTALVDVTGSGLDSVKQVRIAQRDQQFVTSDDGKSIEVLIDGDSIPAPGKYELDLRTDAGQTLVIPVFVLDEQTETCSAKGKCSEAR